MRNRNRIYVQKVSVENIQGIDADTMLSVDEMEDIVKNCLRWWKLENGEDKKLNRDVSPPNKKTMIRRVNYGV